MIEFRWIVLLALWTLLIGPVLDFSRNAEPRLKAIPVKTKIVR
jgi:hypothetical protein